MNVLKKIENAWNNYPSDNHDLLGVYEYSTENIGMFIAIDSLKYGPAVGASRFINGTKRDIALKEVKALAYTMTRKNVLAGMPFGGGKTFIYHCDLSKELMLQELSKALNDLSGAYYTTNDIGVSLEDINEMRKYTPYVKGLIINGEPIPATAYGVYMALKAGVEEVFENGNSDEHYSVSLQGIGSVGMPLTQYLIDDGCEVFVNEINDKAFDLISQKINIHRVSGDFVTLPVDIVCPCAIGGVITPSNVNNITAKLIVGGANNQLLSYDLDEVLFKRGILFVPDLLANYGGMIDLFCEGPDYSYDFVLDKVKTIYNRTKSLISQAKRSNTTLLNTVNRYINEKLYN